MTPACPQSPLVCHIGRHLEQVSLRVFDELGAVVAQQSQEYLLCDVVDVGGGHDALFHEEPAQRHAPLTEPERQALCRLVSTHGMRAQADMSNLLAHKTGRGPMLAPVRALRTWMRSRHRCEVMT